MPPITQPEHVATQVSVVVLQIVPPVHVVVPATQRFSASSQLSTPLHAMLSEQLRAAPTHVALAVHASRAVQNSPSLQLMPVRVVQFVADVAGVHT